MDQPVLVPSNNGNGGQRNHDQIYAKQPPTTTRHKESTPITQESAPSSSMNTVFVAVLIQGLQLKGENGQLPDKGLIQKLLILLLLLGGQIMNTVYFFTEDRMTVIDIEVTFSPNNVLKHSKPGKKLGSFHYRA